MLGGIGAQFAGSGLFTNAGIVTGGNGGGGGGGGGGAGVFGRSGGAGGVGVEFTAGGSFTNSGTVSGGNGGAGGVGTISTGTPGAGAAGIAGAGLTIINSGSISGGLSGDGLTRANAITFTGGTNLLELQAGSTITGNVVGTGSDTLRLGGSTNSSFDVSNVGSSSQYQGFSSFVKTGSSNWTLTNSTIAVTPWTVNQGTLRVSADNNLGATSGGLAFGGGSLQFLSGLTTNRTVTLNTGGGTFDTNGNAATLGGAIAGIGGLTKIGNGTLLLSATSSYTGATTVTGGALTLTGSITSNVNNSATFNNAGGTVTGSLTNSGNASNSGTITAGFINTAGTTTNTGTFNGGATISGGILQQNGGLISGGLTNTATANAAGGSINGAIANGAGGHFNVAGTVTSDSTFNNSAVSSLLAVSGTGNYTVNGLLTNFGATGSGGGINVASGGSLIANGGITNNAGATIVNNGTVNDVLNNVGTVTNNGAYNAEVATNTGTITNSATGTWTGNVTSNASQATGITNNGIWNGNVVANTGTINNNLTWTGSITTSGTFNNTAPGTVSGLVTNSGTGSNSGSLNGGLSNTAGTFANSGTISNGATVTGGALNTNTATSVINGALSNSATVNAQNQINGAVLNQSGGAFNVSGALAGNNTFTNNGTAQLNVTGGNYSGLTTVTNNSTNANGIIVAATRMLSAASLTNAVGATINNLGTITTTSTLNNGTITGAYAMSGGTLSGNGNTQNLTVNGGTFAPGSGTAGSSMTVAGSLILQAAATYLVQINPATSSFTDVTGTATLGGAVNAIYANGSYVAKRYTIVTAAGGLGGTTFASVTDTNLPSGFHTSLSYDANDAFLNLLLNFAPPPGSGLSGSQQNVGNAIINFFNTTGGIPIVFGGLTPAGLTQISGETATGSQQATFNAMNQFMGVMTDPFITGRGDPISGGGNPNAYASEETLAYAAKRKPTDALAAIYTFKVAAVGAKVFRGALEHLGRGLRRLADNGR